MTKHFAISAFPPFLIHLHYINNIKHYSTNTQLQTTPTHFNNTFSKTFNITLIINTKQQQSTKYFLIHPMFHILLPQLNSNYRLTPLHYHQMISISDFQPSSSIQHSSSYCDHFSCKHCNTVYPFHSPLHKRIKQRQSYNTHPFYTLNNLATFQLHFSNF